MTHTYGTLYAVGVGPGDPELITLKARRLLSQSGLVFAACSTKNDESLAYSIIASYVRPGVRVVNLGFPMTKDEEQLRAAWSSNARQVADALATGQSAVFATLGDPLTYSTFGYLLKTLAEQAPEVPVEVVPGVTSYQAAAASRKRVLVEAEEIMVLAPATAPSHRLKQALAACDCVTMLKVYRQSREIKELLEQSGLAEDCVTASRVGLDGEDIGPGLERLDGSLPYMTLVHGKRKKHS